MGGVFLEPFQFSQEPSILRLTAWEKQSPGIVAGMTTRKGGVSHFPFASFNQGQHVGDNPYDVLENRKKLSAALGFDFSDWTCSEQVHGNQVVIVDPTYRGAGRNKHEEAIKGIDGLITKEQDLLLASFYADCVPLFFMVPDKHIIGVAHAGWKGTVANIAQNMIETLQNQFHVSPDDVYTAIGPSIGSCCYEVDDRVALSLKNNLGINNFEEGLTPNSSGKYFADLKKINQINLERAGVNPYHMLISGYCTSCQNELFFSHRKEKGKTGRMAAFIGRKKV
jgi:polyphenol oxidase